MNAPDFFIVGAPKCGTTALYEYLRQHPDVFMPERIKEPHFFGSDLVFAEQARLTRAAYLDLFSGAGSKRRLGEASVFYLYSQHAAKEIFDFCPHASIIMMLRDPVDMIHSFHSQRLFKGTEDVTDFASALELENERKQGRHLPKRVGLVQGLYYRELGKYSVQVQRYLTTFGRNQVHVILFDDFRRDIAGVYRNVLRFLNVDPDFAPRFEIVNVNKRVRSDIIRELTKYTPNTLRATGRALMTRSARTGLRRMVRQWNIVHQARSTMDPVLRRDLRLEFSGDVKALEALIDRDLSEWTR